MAVLHSQIHAVEHLSDMAGVEGLMESLIDLIMSAPRSTVWFPAILQAAEAIQLLVIHPVNADKFQQVLYAHKQDVAEGSLESHVRIDFLNSAAACRSLIQHFVLFFFLSLIIRF